jgi:uncharacterized protein YigA (DUF484 family)
MALFEQFRRDQARAAAELKALASDTSAAHRRTGVAERRRDYEFARLAELTPDIRQQTRLEMQLRASQSRLSRARESDDIAAQIHDLEGRLGKARGEASVGNAHPSAPALAQEVEDIERQLGAVTARITSKARELKARFGLT